MRYVKTGREWGFSLLEIVFVLLLLAVLVGVGFAGASHFWKGQKVEVGARKMQSMMMRALRLSVANQKAYAVVVDATRVRLIDQEDVLLLERGSDEVVGIDQVAIADGLEVFVRRWQQAGASREEQGDWRVVELEVINFSVSGICEPVRFRLVDGEDVLEFSLHPLTAFPMEETLLVK